MSDGDVNAVNVNGDEDFWGSTGRLSICAGSLGRRRERERRDE